MERTESIVIQVSPPDENNKIKEMEMFGWSLQSRQELGETYLNPWFIGRGYTMKQKISHVKLHFVRNLNLPNLNKIKEIESEYSSLIFPKPPAFGYYILCAFFSFWGGISLLDNLFKGLRDPIGFLSSFLFSGAFAGFGIWGFHQIKKKRQKNPEICIQNKRRKEKLIAKVAQLF